MKKNGETMNIEDNVVSNVVDNTMTTYEDLTPEEAAEIIRKTRKNVVQRSILEAKGRQGFRRRWVNEKPGAVERKLAEGWRPVKGKDIASADMTVQGGSQMGDTVRKVVNPTQGSKLGAHATLMEIPETIYQEVQKDKEARRLDIEAQIAPKQVAAKKMAEDRSSNSGFYTNEMH